MAEVSSYVAALNHGVARMAGGFPLSNRLIREMHGILLARGRGSDRDAGRVPAHAELDRREPAGNAAFVPPPAHAVADAMASLERFLHDEAPGVPDLIRAGLAHVQFETIHPFLDGNGRIGRLLITLLLMPRRDPARAAPLPEPLSEAASRPLLRAVGHGPQEGDWEAWLAFFLDGVRESAEGAVTTAQRLDALFTEGPRTHRSGIGRRAGSALRVHTALKHRPITSVQQVTEQTGLSFPAAPRPWTPSSTWASPGRLPASDVTGCSPTTAISRR